MADRFSYVAPARVKVLLVPAASVQPSQYQRYVRLLRSSAAARLLDISSISHLRFFNPQTFPQGRVLFDFGVSEPDNHSMYLHDFEPFRKTFIIIAIGRYTKDADNSALPELKQRYPSSISRNVIYFDTPDATCAELAPPSDHSLKYSFYHNSHNLTALDTIMCEIARNFLVALDEYAASYQNITLRSPVSITDSQLLTKRISQAQKRLSSGSSSLKISFAPTSSQSDSKGKLQLKHNGRQSKLLASFYLLAGKYIDALSTFSDALVQLRKAEDYMWMGSALEGLSAAVVMLNYVEVPYQLPNTILTSILLISKSKLRDLASASMEDPSLRMSSESLSSVSISTAANKPSALSPRNSTSSGLGLPTQLNGTQDLNCIPVPELIKYINQKVSNFYQLSANDLENTVPDLVYIESLIRSSKFMTSIYLNGSDISRDFYESLVKSEKISPCRTSNPWFAKADILRELDKVFLLQLVDLDLIDQCTIYCALAAIFDDLEMYRKKAFILRTLLIGLLPKLESCLNSPETNGDSDKITTNLAERHLLLSSLKEIFGMLAECYGFGLQPEGCQADASKNASSSWSTLHLLFIKLYIKLLETAKDYSSLLKVYTLVLTRFVHCLPEDIEITVRQKIERLLYLSYQNNLGLLVQYWDPFLLRLMKLVNNQNKDELVPFAEYSPSRSKTIPIDGSTETSQTNGSSTTPILFDPYNKQVLLKTTPQSQILIKDDVYQLKVCLQNPYSFELEITDMSVVSDGNITVLTIKSSIKHLVSLAPSPLLGKNGFKSQKSVLTLQRMKTEPKLGIEKISRSTLGPLDSPKLNSTPEYVDSSSQATTFSVAPHSIEQFIIPFKALDVGALVIKGLNVVVGSCAPQFFAIALEELPVAQFKLKSTPSDKEKSLQSVVKNLKENNIASRVKTTEIELRVVPQQPTLTLMETSVDSGWLMLFEGERFEFTVSLMNQSSEPINFLSFSFWDSTIQTLTKRLETNTIGNRGLSPIDVYEIEWYLLEFKAFKIMNKKEINDKYKPIQPQKDVKIKYEVTGKRGLTSLKIILEYANKLGELSQCFIKTVELPLNFSILPSIELINCDVLPLLVSTLNDLVPSTSDAGKETNKNLAKLNEVIRSLLLSETEAVSDYCVVLLDLRNSCTEELRIQVDFQTSPQRTFETEDVLRPGKTIRYLLPMKRVSQISNDLKRPIPSLRNKQFVKNYQMSEAMEMEMREAFWLREAILDKIKGVWECNVSGRSRVGSIDFRNIRLNRKMCNTMMFQKVKLVHELLKEDEENAVVQRTGAYFKVDTEQLYTLRTTITNYSEKAITGTLRHVPYPKHNGRGIPKRENLNIDKRILINGLFDTAIHQSISPSQSLQTQVSFCILERGEYEWGSVLDLADDDQPKVIGREPMYILAL